ncbi:cell division protein FtsL [Sporolactobacillus shoreicorticis]|uniref:Cell division protein FtsL n=1 Tax=Sporolactobacillus shoreicorticis TaxID=1923877 RepID=A0ABW5S4R5_9BACL|nr:cell division protein FtsL [Sporolactobacillus shoreicorticis]MCO7126291.1 cell division protein FtsL [Sporolactobacillus shoreicorticis]
MNQSQQAFKVQRQEYVERAPQQEQIVITRRITKGEKSLWIVAGMVIFLLALCIVANQAKLYMASQDAASLQSKINDQSKVTQQLKAESDRLSSPERIVRFAEKELGLKLDIKNIKVLP